MARKPIPGSDDGTWGDILNNFLDVAHTATGELRDSIVTEQKLASTVRSKLNATGGTIPDGSVTATKLANDAVTNDKIATGIAQSKITNLGVDLAAKADISALEGKANTTHTHAIVDVTNLQTSLDSKASVADLANKADVLALAGKASTNHTHAIVDVAGLQAVLDGKASASHTHTIDSLSDVNVTGATDGQALVLQGSQWGAATITSGGSGVTDHGALTGLGDDDHSQYHNNARGDARYYQKSEVDNLLDDKADSSALAGKANTSHTHAIADVTSLQIALDSKANADATVNLTGVQTIAGVKTFSTLPVLPAGNPTSGNQAASKAYVDSVAGGGNTRYYTGGAWQARGASPFPVIYDAGQIDPVPQPTDWLPGDHIISLNPPIAP